MADYVLNGLGGYSGIDFLPRITGNEGSSQPVIGILRLGNNGGIGAFLNAVIITVVGNANSIDVSLDRPMQYDGTYTQTPGGSGYTIGQPTLDVPTESILNIPVNVTTQDATVTSILATDDGGSGGVIYVGFDRNIDATVPSPVQQDGFPATHITGAVRDTDPTVLRLATAPYPPNITGIDSLIDGGGGRIQIHVDQPLGSVNPAGTYQAYPATDIDSAGLQGDYLYLATSPWPVNITSIAGTFSGSGLISIESNQTLGTVASPTSDPPPAPQIVSAAKPTASSLRLTMGTSGGVTALRIAASVRQLRITLSDEIVANAQVTDPTFWTVTTSAPGAVSATITSSTVEYVGGVPGVTLETTEMTNGEDYTLTMPTSYMIAVDGSTFAGSPNVNFTGVGDSPSVLETRVVDDSTIDVIFNEDVQDTGALNVLNYSFSPIIQVTNVRRMATGHYRLTVLGKRDTQLYQLTVSNIVDAANNPI